MTDVKQPDAEATPTDTPTDTPPDPNAVQITVNGRAHVARKGQLVIEAAADAGEYIPRFCYHERMSPVGKCRMCLVECDTGRGPAVTVSCMVAVTPDMKVDTESPTTKRMQEGMLELLLANHPLDCPVCDKGGECPLQDQAFSHGPGESRFVEEKRHYEKPIPISELVFLDRERCILCDRCTRFADEVAGDPLIHFTGRGNNTYISTYPDSPFSSYFSGNTVQICPVGALTASPYRFKARPWDLTETESTCTTCAVGCRTVVQSSRNELLRYQGVDSDPVNWGWMCDKGRFNFESTHSGERVTLPLVRTADGLTPTSWNAALAAAAQLINDSVHAGGAGAVAVLGGARGTNEDAFTWARLAHEVIGTPNVYAHTGDGLPAGVLGLPAATIDDAAAAATVVLLGPDLKEELPVLYLRLRDAAQRGRTKLVEFSSRATGLTRYAWRHTGFVPGTQAAVVADTLSGAEVAAQLAGGPVVVVVGRANLAESSAVTEAALAAVLAAVPSAKVLLALRRGNVMGALRMGMRPGPGGLDSRGALKAAADGALECLVLVGSDPLADFPDRDLVRRAMAAVPRVVAVDTFLTASSSLADVVLPAAAYGEKRGTTTNMEGRVTSVAAKVTPAGTARPDWMIAAQLAGVLGTDFGYADVDQITADIAASVDGFAGVTAHSVLAAPDGVLAAPLGTTDSINRGTVEVAERNSYDFRLAVSRRLYDQGVLTQQSASLAELCGSTKVHVHPLDLERIGAPEGAEVKVSSQRVTIVLPITADAGVVRGTAWVPFAQRRHHDGNDVGELIDAFAAVNDVRIETL
jgi:NADH-quinone oxidoreductase subunit G